MLFLTQHIISTPGTEDGVAWQNFDGTWGVYEKDLCPNTLDEFKKMERFNPDQSWTLVPSLTTINRAIRSAREPLAYKKLNSTARWFREQP